MCYEEFSSLIKKAQNGDQEAKDELVMNNISLVWSIVHRFKHPIYEKEDIFQIGCLGLIKAIDKFDLKYEVAFSTYAVPIILGEIKRYFRDDGALKVSRSIKDLNQKINQIFGSSRYVYKADVVITTKNGAFNKKIIGRNRHELITMDNEVIPINEILDIAFKNSD